MEKSAHKAQFATLLLSSCLGLFYFSSCSNGQFSESKNSTATIPQQNDDPSSEASSSEPTKVIVASHLGSQGNEADIKQAQAKSAVSKSQNCFENDIITKIEFIVEASKMDELPVTSTYKGHESVMKAVKDLGELVENATEEEAASQPILSKNFKDGTESFIVYQAIPPATGPLPAPIFSITLKQQASNLAIQFPVDEGTQPLFSGNSLSQIFSSDAKAKISAISSIRIEKNTVELENKDLSTTFTQSSSSPLVLTEVNRRFLEKIRIKINDILIYEQDNISHAFSKNSAGIANLAAENTVSGFSRIWQDLNMRENPTFERYLQSYLSCTVQSISP